MKRTIPLLFLLACSAPDTSETCGTSETSEAPPWEDTKLPAAPHTGRYAFVTSTLHTGALSGLEGADSICQKLAAKNPKLEGRVFRAWLSTSQSWAQDRIIDSDYDGLYLRLDDEILAQAESFPEPESWWEEPPPWPLFLVGIENPLNQDEMGQTIDDLCLVWTNSRGNGSPVGVGDDDCFDWSRAEGRSIAGLCNVGDASWSRTNAPFDPWVGCDAELHLYCFEVVD